MITAVDTSVLIDVFGADAAFGEASRRALRRARREGALVVGDVVLAEVASVFPSATEAAAVLDRLEVGYVPTSAAAAHRAGDAWRSFRAAGGPRTRLVADFLVGAHALEHADRLLTRDRGFYRTSFRELAILDPSTAAATDPRR